MATEGNLVNGGDASGDSQNNVPPPVVSNLNPTAGEWHPSTNWAPMEKRTLFMTFSRGYPVPALEVRTYFTRKFGEDCVEDIYIEQPRNVEEQAKFGRVTFKVSYIPVAILHENDGDGEKSRHYIGGRAVWFKKYRWFS